MFRRQQQSSNENSDEDDESSSNTNLTPLTAPRSRNNMLLNIGRFLNVSAIGVLSVVSVILFIQLQAVSLQVASEQKQIEELRQSIQQSNSDIQIEVEKQKDLTKLPILFSKRLCSENPRHRNRKRA